MYPLAHETISLARLSIFGKLTARGRIMKLSQASLVALRRILRVTERRGQSLAKASGLTTAQLLALQAIGERETTTPKDVAAAVNVSQATISSLLDRLESKGLVERRKSETDRRQTNLILTDAGGKALLSAPDALQDEYIERFDQLKVWEQAMIVAALERVSSLMDADDLDASPVLDLGDIHTSGRE